MGLKGIDVRRDNVVRPIIECERIEIEEYCDSKGLNPRIDKTNSENIYTRNKIRNVVVPYIEKEFNPNIIKTMDRLSMLVSEEVQYFEKIVNSTFEELLIAENDKEIVLNLKLFNKQEKVIKSKIILYTITRLLGNVQGIEKIHIEDAIKLCSNNIGNKFLTPNKNIKILLKNQKIYFLANQ